MLRGPVAVFLALSVPLAFSIRLGTHQHIGSHANEMEALVRLREVEAYNFADFVKDFHPLYSKAQIHPGTWKWQMREELFQKSKKKIIDHHKGPTKTWNPGFNRFADWHPKEFKKLMGYKPNKAKKPFKLMQSPESTDDGSRPIEHGLDLAVVLPAEFDSTPHLSLSRTYVRDQGACGSCWAVAATTVLEAHLEMTPDVFAALPHDKFEDIALSSQALTSCTQNPNSCGGTGGCAGATSELAFQLVQDQGIPMGATWMYSSGSGDSGTCDAEKMAASKITINGFVKLPSNSAMHLLHALYQVGPVVVSAAASNWGLYSEGIFEDPEDDFTVNHAVAAVGFGSEDGVKFWRIKNSWGPDWGENGYIRLVRDEEDHCGWDDHPEEGTACVGGPDKQWTCGRNGVLFDSSYPVGVHLK